MNSREIAHVVGTRPNLIKLAALYPLVGGTVYHTGQHIGNMSDPFLREFNMPPAYPIETFENAAAVRGTELVIVYGDCRSTLQGAHLAAKHGIRLAHVEAGLRCGDIGMEEERIRIDVDHMSDILFAPDYQAVANLKAENVKGRVHLVGNVMIDTLDRYGVLTLHRPFNVDDPEQLDKILLAVNESGLKFYWPVHPRVQPEHDYVYIHKTEPMWRDDFVKLMRGALVVVTDSGGVQEEAAWLGRHCITVRPSTERPITLSYGNRLASVWTLTAMIQDHIPKLPFWDGRAAERIAQVLRCE